MDLEVNSSLDLLYITLMTCLISYINYMQKRGETTIFEPDPSRSCGHASKTQVNRFEY